MFTDAQRVTRGFCIDIQVCRDMSASRASTYTHVHPFPISEKEKHAHACIRIQFPSHEEKANDECEQAMLGVSSSRLMKKKGHEECEQAMFGETLRRDIAEAKMEKRTRAFAHMLVHLHAPD